MDHNANLDIVKKDYVLIENICSESLHCGCSNLILEDKKIYNLVIILLSKLLRENLSF